jgi:hypothetical protein
VTQRNVRWLLVCCFAPFLFAGGCFVVIGDIPEGSDKSGGGSGGSAGIGGNSGGFAGTAGSGASTADGGVDADAGASSGGSGGSGGTCINPPCDCDGDNHVSESCSETPGDDCNDNDPLVFEGQGGWFSVADSAGSFDYNCDDATTKEFLFVNCADLLLEQCKKAAQGYHSATVPCGGTVEFGGCVWSTLSLSCDKDVAQSNHTIRCH